MIRVRYEGLLSGPTSFAVVNRALTRALIDTGQIDLEVLPLERRLGHLAALDLPGVGRQLGHVDVHVRWGIPSERDGTLERPSECDRFVVYMPWEWGPLPDTERLRTLQAADEVWVPCEWNREWFERSGLRNVHVIPHGADPEAFSPEGPRVQLPTRRSFVFLFAGGAIHRKGYMDLLCAFLLEFNSGDDVCLLFKLSDFYMTDGIATLHTIIGRDVPIHPEWPEFRMVTDTLSDSDMAALLRSADCLVAPYRGEAWAMIPVEAMAAGRPVVVSRYGPSLDWGSESTVHYVEAREVEVSQEMLAEEWGPAAAGVYSWGEPDRASLRAQLRRVFENRDEAREKGKRARERVVDAFTWRHAAERVVARLRELTAR